VLAERIRVSLSVIGSEPATTAQLAAALRELRGSAFGRWLRPAAPIDLGHAVAQRAVVLFSLGGAAQPCSAMVGRLVCHDLLTAQAPLDGIVWLPECGLLPRHYVADMIARGRDAGLPVLAGSSSPEVAADLADLVNVVVTRRSDGPGPDEFLLAVKDPRRVVPRVRPARPRDAG
jgi:hypothetical protein